MAVGALRREGLNLPWYIQRGSEIGRGGTGVVYKVFDERSEKGRALKVLDETVRSSPWALGWLTREAEIQQRVLHPTIPEVYEYSDAWLLMEYIEGRAPRKIPVEQALQIASDIALGLGEMHRLGFVHRDVKRGNLLLNGDRAYLVDFGFAAEIGADDCCGTREYQSPEQILGEPADGRSDVYSLGITLYELLTGRLPFVGRNATQQHISDVPVPPNAVNKNLPLDLSDAVMIMLGKKKARRFQTADEVAQVLIEVLIEMSKDAQRRLV